jgi:hypothetical protein
MRKMKEDNLSFHLIVEIVEEEAGQEDQGIRKVQEINNLIMQKQAKVFKMTMYLYVKVNFLKRMLNKWRIQI